MQESSPNTRADSGGEVTDVLAVSALVVHDFMQRKRTAEYEFSWDAALASTGGVRMQVCHSVFVGLTQPSSQNTLKPFIIPQYLHSRLCSLLENNGVAEGDLDRPEYWKGRLSQGDLSSLSASEEAVSLVFEVNIETENLGSYRMNTRNPAEAKHI